MQVGVDETCIGSSDLRSSQVRSFDVGNFGLQVVHHLSRLHKLTLVSISELGELIDVLGGADLERDLHGKWLVSILERIQVVILLIKLGHIHM